MAVQNIEQHMYEIEHENPTPRVRGSIPEVSTHDQCYEGRRRKQETPSGSDNEADKQSRRRSPRRRRRSVDSYRSRSRSAERRSRYFEEYRPRRRFEHDMHRPWNCGYFSDWRPRGRRFSWWRGYSGPRYGQGRRGWYGGFDRKPTRFYQSRYSERNQSRPRERDWYGDGYEYVRGRADERVHRRREEYDEDRRSRRDHDHERTRREERNSEDKRGHVTSTRTVPANDYKEDTHRLESTYCNYSEVCT